MSDKPSRQARIIVVSGSRLEIKNGCVKLSAHVFRLAAGAQSDSGDALNKCQKPSGDRGWTCWDRPQAYGGVVAAGRYALSHLIKSNEPPEQALRLHRLGEWLARIRGPYAHGAIPTAGHSQPAITVEASVQEGEVMFQSRC